MIDSGCQAFHGCDLKKICLRYRHFLKQPLVGFHAHQLCKLSHFTKKNYKFFLLNETEQFFFDEGTQHAYRELMHELQLSNVDLIDYLKTIITQAKAWQMLNEVIDHSVTPQTAAFQLRKEIEKSRTF